MPNMKNAVKKVKQNIKKSALNNEYTASLKNSVRKTDKAIKTGNKEEAMKNMNNSIKNLDKALSKGLVSKNKVARTKSRLSKKVNSM